MLTFLLFIPQSVPWFVKTWVSYYICIWEWILGPPPQDGAVPVAAYRSSSRYFVVFKLRFYCVFSLLFNSLFVLCIVDEHYPHSKMLLQWFGYLLVTLFVLWSLLVTGSLACSTAGIVYSCNQLITLRPQNLFAWETPTAPQELRRRRRGCRAGVKWRRKSRKFEPWIPAVITGNARSLANKRDELEVLARMQRE